MARMSADERRSKLLEAALHVMEREGVAAGTTRAIVAEADMPLAAFHYCFRSRDELLRELMRMLSAVEQRAVSAAMPESGDLRSSLRQLGYGYLAHLEANPGHEQVLFELNHYALRTPSLRDLALEQYEAYYRTTAEMLTQAAELSGAKWTLELPLLARTVVVITDGMATTWLADRDSGAARAVLDGLIDYLASLAVSRS